MKIFIFEDLEHVSDRYHERGGLVVIAENKEEVMKLIEGSPIIIPEHKKDYYDGCWDNVVVQDLNGNPEPTYYVFENAGCC
ncbi:MAG: hypothetical protein GX025_10330 [Clostridiales bacterium]|nr:hypothetical protein [Clostridiales bacterium]